MGSGANDAALCYSFIVIVVFFYDKMLIFGSKSRQTLTDSMHLIEMNLISVQRFNKVKN